MMEPSVERQTVGCKRTPEGPEPSSEVDHGVLQDIPHRCVGDVGDSAIYQATDKCTNAACSAEIAHSTQGPPNQGCDGGSMGCVSDGRTGPLPIGIAGPEGANAGLTLTDHSGYC